MPSVHTRWKHATTSSRSAREGPIHQPPPLVEEIERKKKNLFLRLTRPHTLIPARSESFDPLVDEPKKTGCLLHYDITIRLPSSAQRTPALLFPVPPDINKFDYR